MANNFLDLLQLGKVLTPQELQQKEVEFANLELEEKQVIWEELNTFFKKVSVEVDKKYWLSYFRWYTFLSWKNLGNRDEEFVSTIAIPRQIVMASLLDFNIVKELIWYLHNRPMDDEDLGKYYTKLKDNLFRSTSFVGMYKGKDYTMQDLIKEVTLIEQNDDSLKLAELLSRLQTIIFYDPKLFGDYIDVSPEDVVNTVINLVTFCIGVKPESVWHVAEANVHEDRFEQVLTNPENKTQLTTQVVPPQSSTSTAPRTSNIKLPPPLPPVISPPTTNSVTPQKKNVSIESSLKQKNTGIPPVSKRPSNTEIKTRIEQKYPTAPSGEITNFEEVTSLLASIAEKYHDPSIEELCYYNEQDGKFYWNNELIK